MAASDSESRSMYIYKLKWVDRKALCDILDPNDKWEELGGRYMEYDVNTLENIKTRARWNQSSPTNQLLQLWGEQNHTVLELFVLLSEMHHYRAMDVLKPLVDRKYHRLCERGEENLSLRIPRPPPRNPGPGPSVPQPVSNGNWSCSQAKEDSKTGESYLDHNLDKKRKDSTIPQKVALPPVESKIENNSTSKILNTVKPKEDKDRGLQDNKERALQDNKENRGPAAPRESQRKLSNETIASSNLEICISYNELGVATNGWDRRSILGRGGFGTVYGGTWKNTLVAIKKLESQVDASEEFIQAQIQQSLREIKFLNQFRHDNILPLYGYSFDGDTPCLVYQYMINGSLEDRLQCRKDTQPLSWVQRCHIATGIARGLQFLHFRKSPVSSKPLIHGDIKSANILLDPCFVPKIGDFGLAREGPPEQYTHVTVSRVHGTRPYLPADFLRHKRFSTKVDTYSFGVVLFEIATGLRVYDESRRRFLRDYVMSYDDDKLEKLADLKAEINNATIARGLLLIGKDCVKESPRERPEMEGVLGRLDSLTELLERIVKEQESIEKFASVFRLMQLLIDSKGMIRQGSPLSPTTPYTMQIYYDNLNNMSIQRVSPVPNSTAVVGSAVVRRISPQPIPQQMLQPHVTNNPQISVTPPSASTIGTLSQNGFVPSNTEPSRNEPEVIADSSVDRYDVSSVDDLPLLSALGVKG